MKKMKKITIILLMITILIASASCTKEKDSKDKKITVGIIQLADNGAFTDMREGFISQLRELGYSEDELVINYKNAQGDMTNLNAICQEMVNENVDVIAAIATPAAQAIVNMGSDIPVIFISVSNPIGAGIISDLKKPDKNATGTSNAIPVDELFKLSDSLTPEVKTFGLLYNTGEINSVTTINNAKKYLTANGYKYVETIVTNSSEVQQAAQSLVGKVDAIFVPNDSVIQSAMPQVAEIAKEAKIPVYGSSAVMVASGAFATISISDVEIGKMSADMADQYIKGTPINEIPAVVVSSFETVINKATADAIGVKLSEETLNKAVILTK